MMKYLTLKKYHSKTFIFVSSMGNIMFYTMFNMIP